VAVSKDTGVRHHMDLVVPQPDKYISTIHTQQWHSTKHMLTAILIPRASHAVFDFYHTTTLC